MSDWHSLARGRGRPSVMGIVNVTPDSFSDGGKYLDPVNALAHALEMIDDGVDIIDVGGESTRPGSEPIDVDEELKRIIPVISELSQVTDVPISIDTMKAKVAEAAIDAGASIVNDIYGLRGKGMMDVVASSGVTAVIMHMHGTPKTLATNILEGDATEIIRAFLWKRTEIALDAGIRRNNIILDPGIGFGLTSDQSMEVLKNCRHIAGNLAVLVGASRKRFLSDMFPGVDRECACIKSIKIAKKADADIVRVHEVSSTIDALLDTENNDQCGYNDRTR